jgi:rhodanese-related sulfurtransferase
MSSCIRRVLYSLCVIFAFLIHPVQILHAETQGVSVAAKSFSSISAEALQARLAEKKPLVLLDVRQQEEYDAGHFDNAILIPLSALPERYAELPKDKEIIVYCRSGKRSAKAAEFLVAMGFTNITNLEGGYVRWMETMVRK